jgi:hypothetical protein
VKDHPYSDPNRWPTDRRGLRNVRVYFEALALMHRCRALDLQIRHRPRVSAVELVAATLADALNPARS